MQQRKACSSLTREVRELAVREIKAAGGLDYARDVVVDLQAQLERGLTVCEKETGSKNWILRLMQKRLEI